MRLMYVLPAEGFGGAERQGVLHIRKLAESGVELTAVVGPGQPVQQALRHYGFTDYHYCADFHGRTHSDMSLLSTLRYDLDYASAFLRSSAEIARIGRASGTELILAGRSFGWAVAARAARSLGIPYIVRAGSRATSRGALLAIRMLRTRYGRPRALLSNCYAVEKTLINAFDCPGSIVRNGVDTHRFDPDRVQGNMRSALGLADRPVIGLAARPAPEKGMDVFAETVQRCCLAVPEATFLVAGEFGWRRYYEKRFAELGLQEQVRFLGHVEDMPEFFASCDVVILTSLERSIEGSPNAILEAMAMGRPVVASNVGGIPEIITDGMEGYLVHPDDSQGFASRITSIVSEPSLRAALGQAGRATILERYSEHCAMEALTEALNRFGVGEAVSSPQSLGA